MILLFFVAWIALGVVAVAFIYCCSRVSNRSKRELEDNGLMADSLPAFDPVSSTPVRRQAPWEARELWPLHEEFPEDIRTHPS